MASKKAAFLAQCEPFRSSRFRTTDPGGEKPNVHFSACFGLFGLLRAISLIMVRNNGGEELRGRRHAQIETDRWGKPCLRRQCIRVSTQIPEGEKARFNFFLPPYLHESLRRAHHRIRLNETIFFSRRAFAAAKRLMHSSRFPYCESSIAA